MSVKQTNPENPENEVLQSSIISQEDLFQTAEKINRSNAHYVLAPSRKGPRSLEMISLSGMEFNQTNIISEKSIDFIHNNLRNRKVLVFDDVIISGRTIIQNIADSLRSGAQDIEAVAIAIEDAAFDIDEISLEDGDIKAIIKKDAISISIESLDIENKIIPLSYQKSLSKSERESFSRDEVESFCHLNKPYDIDFSIFYSTINKNNYDSIFQSPQSYRITTTKQSRAGYERYSVFPERGDIEKFTETVFGDIDIDLQIQKVRVYYAATTGEFTFVPIVIFRWDHEEYLNKGRDVFHKDLDEYNDLLDELGEFIGEGDQQSEEIAICRSVYYIVSYLYGLFFIQKHGLDLPGPKSSLNPQDLSYIFTPEISEYLIDELTSKYEKTLETFEDTASARQSDIKSPKTDSKRDGTDDNPLDADRQQLFHEIEDYLDQHMDGMDVISFQLATIFEGLNELLEEEASCKKGEKNIRRESKYLNRGFNFNQLHWILKEKGDPSTSELDSQTSLSLAMDYLIDKGVQIPIFKKDDSGIYERVYRQGETVRIERSDLIALVGSVMNDFFDHLNQQYGKTNLHEIEYEKIGVMVLKEIYRRRSFDTLEGESHPEESPSIIEIGPGFMKYGKVLRISKDMEITAWGNKTGKRNFTEWSDQYGIIELDSEHRVHPSEAWLEEISAEMAEEKEDVFENLNEDPRRYLSTIAEQTYKIHNINNNIDNDASEDDLNLDHLMFITTCDDHQSFISALREQLRLFFESDQHLWSKNIENIESDMEENQSYQSLSSLKSQSYEFKNAHTSTKAKINNTYEQIDKKIELWDNSDDLIRDIESTVDTDDLNYSETLGYHINTINHNHSNPVRDDITDFQEKIRNFSIVCLKFARVLECYMNICYKLITNEDQDEDLNELVNKLERTVSELNEYSQKVDNLSEDVEIPSGKISKLSHSDIEVVMHLRGVFLELSETYNCLEGFYNSIRWEEKLKDLFPDPPTGISKDTSITDYEWIIYYEFKSDIKEMHRTVDQKIRKLDQDAAQGYQYTEDRDELFDRILDMLGIATEGDTFLRIGVCSCNEAQGKITKDKNGWIEKGNPHNLSDDLVSRFTNQRDDQVDSGYHTLVITDRGLSPYRDRVSELEEEYELMSPPEQDSMKVKRRVHQAEISFFTLGLCPELDEINQSKFQDF